MPCAARWRSPAPAACGCACRQEFVDVEALAADDADLDGYGEVVDLAEQIRALLDRSPSPTCCGGKMIAVIVDRDVVPAPDPAQRPGRSGRVPVDG